MNLKTFRPIIICLVLPSWLAIVPPAGDCQADTVDKAAFATADVGLQTVVSTNRGDFHRYWTSSPGLEGYVSTPFYRGDIQLGGRMVSFESRTGDVTDYLSVFVYAGWGLSWALPYNVKGFTGFNIGSDQMLFEFEDRPGSKHESEFGMTLNVSLSAPLRGRWSVTAGGNYSEIFTYNRIRLVFVSVGLSRSFDLPVWLKEFLK